MTPYTEVLMSYWNLHGRRRLRAQDLQVMADVVGSLCLAPQRARIEVGILLPGRCLGLDGTGGRATIGCVVKARHPICPA